MQRKLISYWSFVKHLQKLTTSFLGKKNKPSLLEAIFFIKKCTLKKCNVEPFHTKLVKWNFKFRTSRIIYWFIHRFFVHVLFIGTFFRVERVERKSFRGKEVFDRKCTLGTKNRSFFDCSCRGFLNVTAEKSEKSL